MNNNPHDLRALRWRCQFDKDQAARFLGVSLRTYYRYEETGATVPRTIWHLMLYRAGFKPIDGWAGFFFESNKVWTPQNEMITTNELLHFRWLLNELASPGIRRDWRQRVNYQSTP